MITRKEKKSTIISKEPRCKLKVKVTAAGNANYEPLTKTVTVKIRVK